MHFPEPSRVTLLVVARTLRSSWGVNRPGLRKTPVCRVSLFRGSWWVTVWVGPQGLQCLSRTVLSEFKVMQSAAI